MKKNKTQSSGVSLLRASSLCLMLAGPSVALAADDSNHADISATVSVQATEACHVTVAQVRNSMAMSWTRSAEGVSSTTLTSGSTEPVYVTVATSGGENCNLNGLQLRTEVAANMELMKKEGGNSAFRVKLNEQGAYWRILPILADAHFFTDEQGSQEGDGVISWNGPGASDNVASFSKDIQKAANLIIDADGVGEGKFLFMTDEYVANGAGALLIEDGNQIGHFESNAQGEKYKSAKLGFGALIATDPENVDEERSPELASSGDQATFSWVVNIDQA